MIIRAENECSVCGRYKLTNTYKPTSDSERTIEDQLNETLTACIKTYIDHLPDGFKQIGRFVLDDEGELDFELWEKETQTGVYVILVDEKVKYIGQTFRRNGISSRLKGYINPGPSQKTNQKIKPKIINELEEGSEVAIQFFNFNSLERQLIHKLNPTWNNIHN